MIDPHVHLRDGEERHKETLQHGLKVAEKLGLSAVFDMPNTRPPVLCREDIHRRLTIAKAVQSSVYYGLYCGLTSDPGQIAEAVACVRETEQVVGLKLYAGHSTGDLAVTGRPSQETVFRVLSEHHYRGVLAVHCESETYFQPDLWDPQHPLTHTLVRPPAAELHAINTILELASQSRFNGTLHICHISLPESVKMIETARRDVSFSITCGATPHHLLLHDMMMEGPEGLLLKMNPPLRSERDRAGLMDMMLAGRIDWARDRPCAAPENGKTRSARCLGHPRFSRTTLSDTGPS
ncbi:MAG: dihydroorotase [Candidatus Marinimicrobia bacterium]|nr:dihydroorotase [Candidatus Neomarinimicrobiota bacterium]